MDDLVSGLARDVDSAFPAVVARYADGLYSGVRRLVPQPADAEDACAEALLRAYRALQAMSPDAIRGIDLTPWLWTIALNVCRNAARRRSRKPWVTLDPAWAGAGSDPQPDQQAADRAHVEDLLRRLPPAQRTALVLRHVVGLPYREIAAATGRPESSIRSDVKRGRERLRRSEAS